MAKLSYQQRKKLPPSAFALPKGTPERRAAGKEGGSFPVHDLPHARNALARAHQLGRKGGPIDQAVHRKVGQKFPSLPAVVRRVNCFRLLARGC